MGKGAGEDPELIGELTSRIGWGWAMQDAREWVKIDRCADDDDERTNQNATFFKARRRRPSNKTILHTKQRE